ncbi:MAG TPA: hypothetical protein VJ997_03355 [Longimicrobiales bacterium]|nr:hypothetical protein [Longimicrobiales bacterium]
MTLRDLDDMGLLLPREHWGHTPHAGRRTTALTVFAALLGLASAWVVWSGQGGIMTFVGLGLFLVDLAIFQVVTFLAVEDRMERLGEIDAESEASPGAPGPGGPVSG